MLVNVLCGSSICGLCKNIPVTHVRVYVHALAWMDVIAKKGNVKGETNMLEWTYALYSVHADNLPGIVA